MQEHSRKPAGFIGIQERHSRSCRTTIGGACNCKPSYRAEVYDRRTGKKARKTFSGSGALAAAKAWRADATSQQNRGTRIAPARITLREQAERWLAGTKANPPTVLKRGGEPYKPGPLREYERDLRRYLLPELGAVRLSDLQRADLQAFVDRLLGRGVSAAKVRNPLMPLRAIYRHALERDIVTHNPTSNLRLPAATGRRDRVLRSTSRASRP